MPGNRGGANEDRALRGAIAAFADSITADIMKKTLKIAGFGSLHVAETIEEVSAKLASEAASFDLIIAGMQLADGDGYQLIEKLAEHKFRGGLIVADDGVSKAAHSMVEFAEANRVQVLGTYEARRPLGALLDLISEKTPNAVEGRSSRSRPTISLREEELEDWQVEAVFQPKVSLASGETVGFEALARWHHPEHGLLAPPFFLSLIEQKNLIHKLTEEILEQSLAILPECRKYAPRATMSVNLSAASLLKPGLPDQLLRKCEKFGIRPSAIIFEVTETQFLGSDSSAMTHAHRIGMMGFGLSLDDYGTGYSSLSRLKSLPFTELKVDRRFCHNASRRPPLQPILRSCVQLGRELNLKVTAEGIEDPADRDLVKAMGFDIIQGYIESRPLPGNELIRWLEQRHGSDVPGDVV